MTLLDDYRTYLKEQGLAENTIQTYCRHVGEYCQWYEDTFRAGTGTALPHEYSGFPVLPAEYQKS